jgi:tight adherence protein C
VRAIARGLPDALELLVICVEAGLSLEDAIERVVSELWESHPELSEELALTSADLKILPSRDQALANLADRVDLPGIRSIVGTLSQTMRFGTPLAQAMRVVASEMRNDALLNMEERANRLPALMTVPMIVFILPTIFMILGGPAVLRVIDTMAQ